jgi:molybdenum cofactor cytidylyltransferase
LTPPTGLVAALVLGAGSATRMGRLKQLLPYAGRTLVAYSIGQAIEAGFHPVVVVVGAEAAAVREAVAALPVEIVENDSWQSGMGSSITAGMRHLETRNPWAIAFLLADQPLVTSHHLREMASLAQNPSANAVAAEYNGRLGVPALFKRQIFSALESLAPETGARHLLRSLRSEIAAYPLPEAAIDIDTPDDFEALRTRG